MSPSIQDDIQEASAWLTLLRTPSLGAGALRKLIDRHGNARAVIECARSKSEPEITETAYAYLNAFDQAELNQDLAWLAEPQHHLLTWNSEDYPALLRNISGAPAALFVVGDPDVLWSPQLAVIGSRNATASGLATARKRLPMRALPSPAGLRTVLMVALMRRRSMLREQPSR